MELPPLPGFTVGVTAGRRREFRAGPHHVVVSGGGAVVDGEPVALSPRERRVLAALAERPGVLLSKTALLERAWPGEIADQHAVEAAVARLRRRLGPAGRCIETVVRRGYRLAVN